MNKYEVVCSIGWNHHVIQNVEAHDEKEARKIVWEKELSDNQRDNCEDIEVFLISEKEDKNLTRYNHYTDSYNKLKKGEITDQQWTDICLNLLGEIMEENKEMYKRMKAWDRG